MCIAPSRLGRYGGCTDGGWSTCRGSRLDGERFPPGCGPGSQGGLEARRSLLYPLRHGEGLSLPSRLDWKEVVRRMNPTPSMAQLAGARQNLLAGASGFVCFRFAVGGALRLHWTQKFGTRPQLPRILGCSTTDNGQKEVHWGNRRSNTIRALDT